MRIKSYFSRFRGGYKSKKELAFFLKKYAPRQNRESFKLISGKENLILRKCPVCASQTCSFFLKAPMYAFVRCRNCSMVYANNILKPEIDAGAYTAGMLDEYWQLTYETYKQTACLNRYAPVITNILRFCRDRDSLLDIGCSFGGFLQDAKIYFKNCDGVEVNKKMANIAMGMGFNIYTKPFEDLKIKDTYDVVVINNLIEHISDLNGFLKDVNNALKKGGILFITCPNSASLSFKLFRKRHMHVYDRFHVNLFTPETISVLLARNNFHVKEVKTDNTLGVPSMHLGIYSNFFTAAYLVEGLLQKTVYLTNFLRTASRGLFLEAIAKKNDK